MKRFLTAVSILGLAATAPLGLTAHTDAPLNHALNAQDNPDRLSGMIASVAENGESFQLRTADGLETIKVDHSTEYSIDGSTSDRATALKIGYEATVHLKDGTAKRVEAKTRIEPPLL